MCSIAHRAFGVLIKSFHHFAINSRISFAYDFVNYILLLKLILVFRDVQYAVLNPNIYSLQGLYNSELHVMQSIARLLATESRNFVHCTQKSTPTPTYTHTHSVPILAIRKLARIQHFNRLAYE